jgi:hypothetical protein
MAQVMDDPSAQGGSIVGTPTMPRCEAIPLQHDEIVRERLPFSVLSLRSTGTLVYNSVNSEAYLQCL